MNLARIKKELYRQKPTAKRYWMGQSDHQYITEIMMPGSANYKVYFKIPVSEIGENTFSYEEPAQLLIRWLQVPKEENEKAVEIEMLTGPGDTLGETLLTKAIEQLVEKTDLTTETVAKLLKNELVIHIGIAIELEAGTGIPAQFWMNRDENYRAKLAEIEAVFNR